MNKRIKSEEVSAMTEQTMLRDYPIEIRHEKRRVAITEVLGLEWQSGPHNASKLGMRVEVEQRQSHSQLRIATPKVQGWIRMVRETMGRAGQSLLGVRIVLRISSSRRASHEDVKLTVSRRVDEKYIGLREGSSQLRLKNGTWCEIRGVVDCDGVDGDLGFLLNLPKDCEVQILAFDTDWFELSKSGATPERDEGEIGFLSPFEVSVLGAEDSLPRAEPVIYAAALETQDLDICGWIFADQALQLRLRCGKAEVPLSCETSVEIGEGYTIPTGFRLPAHDLMRFGATDLELLAGDNRELATIRMPDVLVQEIRRRQRYEKSGTNKLFFYPDYTETNPYQLLMYQNMPNTVSAGGDIDDALDEIRNGSSQVVFHLHWLNRIYGGSKNGVEAEHKCRVFLKKLAYFVGQGGVLIWTVHNTFSHDPAFRDVEINLAQSVADMATWIHLHSRTLLAELEQYYDLAADKLIIEPHPNFVGAYPDYVTRETARAHFGLDEAAKVYLFIGQIRPYKGVEELIWSFSKLRDVEPDAQLLIVGRPVYPYSPGHLSRKYKGVPNVRIIEGHVPDDRLQWYYRAADWVVLPYKNILTSGSLLCAQSFGRPVIAPRRGMIADVLQDGCNGLLYDPDASDGLQKALNRSAEITLPDLGDLSAASYEAVRELTWQRMGSGLEAAIARSHDFRVVPIPFEDGERDCVLMGPSFPPEKPARTAIIILNYEHLDDVQRLIGTLGTSSVQDFDIYVVDNCSPNITEYDLQRLLPEIYTLRLPENLGYAAGNNAVMRLIESIDYEFVWILNPDMVVSPLALEQHIEAARQHEDHDIFGAVILKGGNSHAIGSAGGYLSLDNGVSTGHMFSGDSLDVLPKAPYTVDFVTGASVFMRKALLSEIGLIPEDYFLYFEETHWLLEAKRQGYDCLVLPDVRLAHHKRSEEGGLPAKYYFYYYLRNSLLFTNRMSPGQVQATLSRLRSGFINAWLKRIEQRAPHALDIYRTLSERAIEDGLAGRAGKIDLIALELSVTSPIADASEDVHEVSVAVSPKGLISGLVKDGSGPSKVHSIAIVSGSAVIGEADIRSTRQNSSFQFQLPRSFLTGAAHSFEVYVNGRPATGGSCSALLPQRPPLYKGRIDGLKQYICSGWIWNTSAPGEPVPYEILHDGEVIATGLADIFRPDLKRNAVSDGHAGFRARLPRAFSNGKRHKVELRVAGEAEVLFSRDVLDGEVNGGLGPRPAEEQLKAMFYDRHGWLGAHDWDTLPVGRYMARGRETLINRHRGANSATCVSVIMPVFNREDTVLQSIASVRAQSHENWELLVVDDGSSDDSVETVRQYISETGDQRIRLLPQSMNRGVSAARNVGLTAAHGAVIAYLDSDNIWLPDFLSVMVGELMSARNGTFAAYCGQNILHVRGSGEEQQEELIAVRFGEFSMPLIENRNYIDLNCYVHTREAWERLGGFDESIRRLVDWELILRYARENPPRYVPALLSNYYFEKTSNQITSLEDFSSNFAKLKTLAERCPVTRDNDTDLPAVDVVWLCEAQGDAAVNRCRELLFTLNEDARLIAFCASEDLPMLTELAQEDVRLQVQARTDTAPDSGEVALTDPRVMALVSASRQRRTGAHLVYLQSNAQPEIGWLEGFGQALQRVPDAGLLVSRHIVPGADPRVQKAAPFASRALEICITISSRLQNVVDPDLDPEAGLMEISGFKPFCVLMRADLLNGSIFGEAETDQISIEELFGELQTFCATFLRQKTVYCGEVLVHEI